jgi:two-component system, sensor histidine kinase and response regulator
MFTPDQCNEFTILLVDDRPENLISLEEILSCENRIFIKAASGNEALRHVLKNDHIGLIMLDVQMPGMDGFEVAHILKSNPKTQDISIIFVTAISKDEQYVMKGFEEGAVDYLQKPLDINVTRAKVNVFEQLYFHQRDLKRTAAELTKINRQLEKFVYIVAHDLKSPLTGLIAALSILEMQKEDNNADPEVLEYVEYAKSAAYHLSTMINDLLDYSRKSVSEQTIEEVDVYELLTQLAHLLFPPHHIHIIIHKPMPILKTRKLKLQQVFQNLISNAIKYNDKPNGLIEVGAREVDSFFEFYVRDNGPGVSNADQESMFNLFQTATSTATIAETSTGVGLNILKMLVEEQGGKIHIKSEPGTGTTFLFTWAK